VRGVPRREGHEPEHGACGEADDPTTEFRVKAACLFKFTPFIEWPEAAFPDPKAPFIVAVLGVLEVSLSFDNAVVNAKVLAGMDAVWRHRFLT
jgi:hypothetical protein